MFSNLLGHASGGSSGNNANEIMDTLRELEDDISDNYDSKMKQFWVEIFNGITKYHEFGARACLGATPNNALELYIFCAPPEQSACLYSVISEIHDEARDDASSLMIYVDPSWEICNPVLYKKLFPKLHASLFMGCTILLGMRLLLMHHMIETVALKWARAGRIGYY
jgi:hypothetical protein